MDFTLHVWRQSGSKTQGQFRRYEAQDINPHMSFLEMLDVLNEGLIGRGEEPIAFDHDCREGICGICGMVVNGSPHGPKKLTTVCQLHMREFTHGQEIWIEPWRAGAFPILKDLVVDRSGLDRIIQAGGYVSVPTGSSPDGNAIPIAKEKAELAFDAAACIGCGACVAACPNASAMLFTAAKISHLGSLPQGQPERHDRSLSMVEAMDRAGFGNCTNHAECEAACPKGIGIQFIAQMNRDHAMALISDRGRKSSN